MDHNYLITLKQDIGKNIKRCCWWHQCCLLAILSFTSSSLQADISAVVIETDFTIGAWQPLPEDKIKSASVDSALSEISKAKRFAFFTSPPVDIKTGILKISIKLVEAAETATVSVSLRQANGASISSTHSESLKNKNYDGIYKQFQKAGEMAGKKIVRILQSKVHVAPTREVPAQDQKRILYLENQIISINNKIINQAGNNSIRSEAKLEFILNELKSIKNSYADLAKKEDIRKQGIKIDKVLDEVGQLNKKIDNKPMTQINTQQSYVLENALIGKNTIPSNAPAGVEDAQARQLYNSAQKFKRDEKYSQAEKNLLQAIKLKISPELRSLIYDELVYSLPMYEAQAIAIKLGRNFQAYSKTGQDNAMLNRISYLYETALKNNQNDFQRTRQIQTLLDQHYNSRHAMSAVVSVQNKMNAKMLHHYLYENFVMKGEYPNKNNLEQVIKSMGLRFKVLAYQRSLEKYTVTLESSAGEQLTLKADGSGRVVIE